jgi:DNA uptake protein ComE-like DNA-binding protein
MATKGERQALLFLAAVALLGAGTRACRARAAPVPAGDLDRQIAAVEVPRARQGNGKRGARPARHRDSSRQDDTSSAAAGDPHAAVAPSSQSVQRLDLDTAPAADIDRLPGVGPALAKRIVANRDSGGAFGCLAALDAVKGVGPALLRRIDSLVTFGGARREPCGQR